MVPNSDGSGSKKSGFERARVVGCRVRVGLGYIVQIPAGYINSGIPGTRRVIEEKKVPKF